MESRKFDARQLLKEKKFWVASFLIAWAAALQGHMMWLQRQDRFKQKFGDANPDSEAQKQPILLGREEDKSEFAIEQDLQKEV